MKTINLKKVVLYFGLMLAITYSKNIFSQQPTCTYLIANDFDCAVTVKIDWYDDCTGGATNFCDSQTTSIPANGPTSFTCSGCSTANMCNIVVTLVSIGGVSIGAIVDKGTWYSSSGSGSFSGCNGNTNWHIDWHASEAIIGF